MFKGFWVTGTDGAGLPEVVAEVGAAGGPCGLSRASVSSVMRDADGDEDCGDEYRDDEQDGTRSWRFRQDRVTSQCVLVGLVGRGAAPPRRRANLRALIASATI
jgi:hypothetical protein